MQSELEKVTEALRDELTEGSFSMAFVPVDSFDPTMQLEDAGTLQVDVVPVKSDPERITRGSIKWTNIIDIGIRFRFGTSEQDDTSGQIRKRHVQEFLYLEQEIIAFLMSDARYRLRSYQNAVLEMAPEVRVSYVPKHLREWRQFTGILRVGYRTETEIT